jgi:hypothetical protein
LQVGNFEDSIVISSSISDIPGKKQRNSAEGQCQSSYQCYSVYRIVQCVQ